MTQFIKVAKVIDDPKDIPDKICPSCVGLGTEKLNGISNPCESCDGTGRIRIIEVVALVSVSSNVKHIWEV